MSEQIFLTLSSDSPCEFQTANKPSSFKVHLGRVLQLNGQWEVCLFEVFYPATLHNLRKNACTVIKERTSYDAETGELGFMGDLGYHAIYLESKAYGAEKDLIDEINLKCHPGVSVAMNENKFVEMNISAKLSGRELHTFKIRPDLRHILGFSAAEIDPTTIYQHVQGNSKFDTADYAVDLRRGLTSTLTVTTNIIVDQIINNTQAKILRTFHVDHYTYENGFSRKAEFSKLIFLPVAVKKIECIEINIFDDTKDFASFLHGHLTVVLLFRKVGHE
jgi:hypothetical protein